MLKDRLTFEKIHKLVGRMMMMQHGSISSLLKLLRTLANKS